VGCHLGFFFFIAHHVFSTAVSGRVVRAAQFFRAFMLDLCKTFAIFRRDRLFRVCVCAARGADASRS
jgi:hypothetical protein